MHIDEDKLIAYALDTLDDNALRSEIEAHLENCVDCKKRLEHIRGDIDIIAGIQPMRGITPTYERSLRPTPLAGFARAAVLVLVGVAAGLGISRWLHTEPAPVSGLYAELSPPADSMSRFAPSDATSVDLSRDGR